MDEVIEVKGKRKDSVSKFKQELDAQLLKRDTSAIRAQIGVMASDNHITPQEKQILKRELQIITSNYGLVASKAEEYGLLDQTEYLEFVSAYASLSAYLQPLLADLESTSEISSHEELTGKFGTYYDASSVMEERFFRYTTGMIGGLDWREKFEVRITSSLGLSVPLDNTPTSLSVMLLHNGEDVTSEYPDEDFVWARVSEDRVADAAWEAGKNLAGRMMSRASGMFDMFHGPFSFFSIFS
ncbi:MAG: hypothetical protein EOM68_06975, partial [Spirochaetia bacterium]|nr:hypothetical protein [Spirochaetia bacterium]